MAEFWMIAGAVFTGLLGVLVVLWLYRQWRHRRAVRWLVRNDPVTASWLYWGAVGAKNRSRR